MNAARSVLLLGPTGAGKTPLGLLLEKRRWRGRRCVHFDFGENLRRAAAGRWTSLGLSAAETVVVRRSLRAGALLEDEHFPIALKILKAFLKRRAIRPPDFLILNGLPRHAGQARGLDGILRVEAVVHLSAPSPILARRIRLDAGGDRAARSDDSPDDVRRKLALFRRRTLPLLAFYRRRGVPVLGLKVTVGMTAEDMRRSLEARLCFG